MAKRFFFLCAGVLCLAAAYQVGTESARAEWDGSAAGSLVGGGFAAGGPWIAFTSAGEAWSITPGAGWIRRVDADLPVPAAEVKFLDSNGELFILITTGDDVWQFVDNGLGWFRIDSFPGGPISLPSESWGKVKAAHR